MSLTSRSMGKIFKYSSTWHLTSVSFFLKCQATINIQTKGEARDVKIKWEILKIGESLGPSAPPSMAISANAFEICFQSSAAERKNMMPIDTHVIVHFRADSPLCKQWEFFPSYLFSSFCLAKSNYVCIRLSTGLFLCRTIGLPPSLSHFHYVILSVELGRKATNIPQLGSEMLTCPLQKENGPGRKGNCMEGVKPL